MTMSIDSFYETLSGLDLIWLIGNCSELRCEAGDCPIIAVHRARFKDIAMNNAGWHMAARNLGLNDDTADDILDAADSKFGVIRTELLKACKIDAEWDLTGI